MAWHSWIESYGYFGIMLSLMFPFLPSEVPLAYAGYLVHTTEFNLIVMLIVAVMSFVISQNIFFTIGRLGSDRLLKRIFRWFRISETKMVRFQRQMDTRGRFILLLSPMWRMGFAIGAGLTGVSRLTFTIATTISFLCGPLFYLGRKETWTWHDGAAS
ncbi:DedA family protein [Exiguobacterium artemiae]